MKRNVLFYGLGMAGVALACVAQVFGQLPFGEGAVLLTATLGVPVWLTLPVYIAMSVWREPTLFSLWRILACAVAAVLCALCCRKRKWLVIPCYVVSRVGEIATFLTATDLLPVAMGIVAGGVVLSVLQACRKGAKFTLCGIVLISMIVGAGMHAQAVLGAFGVGFWCYLFKREPHALKSGMGYLVGGLLATQSLASFAVGVIALSVGGMLLGRVWWLALSLFATYLAASIAIGDSGLLPCAGVAAGCLLGALLPAKSVERAPQLGQGRRMARLLRRSASACRSMEIAFDGNAQDVGALTSSFAVSLCAGCPSASTCTVAESVFFETVRTAVARGRAGLDLIPESMIEQCCRASDVPKKLAAALSEREHNLALNDLRATASALVTGELNAFSGLLFRLAERAEQAFTQDGYLTQAMSELLGEQVVVTRAGECVSVRAKAATADEVQDALSEAMARELVLDASEQDGAECEYVFLPAPKLALTYGVRQVCKNGASLSGDTYTVRSLRAGIAVSVLCDGMGSGRGASILSERTVSVMEACFAVGFTVAEILPIVNLLLQLGGESFSCVDVCMCDLNAGQATFVKMGSVESYIVRGEEVLRIEGDSLPLGVERAAVPSVATVDLKSGDLIVMNTDGVSDVLELPVGAGRNPQQVADSIVERALQADFAVAHDDMTTLVLRAV